MNKKNNNSSVDLIDDLFNHFLSERKSMHVSERTLKYYRVELGKIIQDWKQLGLVNIEDVNNQFVRDYMNGWRDKRKENGEVYSDNYIHIKARVIKTFLRFCVDQEYLLKMPKMSMPKIEKKRLSFLSEGEIKIVLDTCRDDRERAIFVFAVETGLRLEEIVNTNWCDINLGNGLVLVSRGKGGKFRMVGVGSKARSTILKYKNWSGKKGFLCVDDNPLLQTEFGKRFTPRGLESFFKRLSDKSGVEFTPHSLRRTFARQSHKNGTDIVVIQQFMGHSNVETTRRYIQDLDDSVIENSIKKGGVMDRL